MNNVTLKIHLKKDVKDGEVYVKNKITFNENIILFNIDKKDATKAAEKTQMFVGGDKG